MRRARLHPGAAGRRLNARCEAAHGIAAPHGSPRTGRLWELFPFSSSSAIPYCIETSDQVRLHVYLGLLEDLLDKCFVLQTFTYGV